MAKTYVSNVLIYLNDIGFLRKDLPTPINRMAAFLLAIVEAVTPKCPTLGHNTGIRCRKRGCKGPIHASLPHADGKITWWCPVCEQNGVISGWYGTKWDHTKAGSPISIPRYTSRQGEYLAFIYHYTKRHHRGPAERDIQQEYFRLLQPAVHDMLRRLKQRGLIGWEPGVPRSIKLLLKREELPDLE